jgi:hypothetical protein
MTNVMDKIFIFAYEYEYLILSFFFVVLCERKSYFLYFTYLSGSLKKLSIFKILW